MFRATIILNFGVQSHHHSQFWCSKPSSLLILDFRATISFSVSAFRAIIILSFSIRSHHCFTVSAFKVAYLVLAFRAIIPSYFGIQNHHFYPVWCSESLSLSSSAFRATISFSVRRSDPHIQFKRLEPPSLLILAFRVVSPVRRLESLSLHSLVFRVTDSFIVWHYDRAFIATFSTFRATFLALKAFIFFSLVFRATFSAFRVVIFFQFSIQSHPCYLKPLSSILGVQSRIFSLVFRAIIFFSLAFRVMSSF